MVRPHTGCRFSALYTVTGQYEPRRSSAASIDNRLYLAYSAPFYPRLTGKNGYFLRRICTLLGRKTKNILDTALYFNDRYYRMSSFYSGRKRAFLDREFLAHKRSLAERFGKSSCSASDDLYFAVDTTGTDSTSGFARYNA